MFTTHLLFCLYVEHSGSQPEGFGVLVSGKPELAGPEGCIALLLQLTCTSISKIEPNNTKKKTCFGKSALFYMHQHN